MPQFTLHTVTAPLSTQVQVECQKVMRVGDRAAGKARKVSETRSVGSRHRHAPASPTSI